MPPLPADLLFALRKGGVVWVALEDSAPRLVWHVWHDDALLLVVGGDEQPLPGADAARRAVVVVRDRAALGGELGRFAADVERLPPGSPDWQAAVDVLAPQRLNVRDLPGLADRWAAGSTVLRLRPAEGPAGG